MEGRELVKVTFPARPEFVSVARLTAATVAARRGFTYDEIEDLKIAVGEACTSLLIAGSGEEGPITVRFLLGDHSLEVQVEAKGPAIPVQKPAAGPGAAFDEAGLGIFLMQCLVDEVEAQHDQATGVTRLRLVKRH